MATLRRFWFRFTTLPEPTAINLGCGVTAFDYEDALCLVRENIFGSDGLPQIIELIEDVDVSKLEAKHVLPNIGPVYVRGIWFPQSYNSPRVRSSG